MIWPNFECSFRICLALKTRESSQREVEYRHTRLFHILFLSLLDHNFSGHSSEQAVKSRFLLENIAVLKASLLLNSFPTKTTKACIPHLPVACGTNWIQSSRVGNKHQEMTCQLHTPVDFAKQSPSP